MMNVQPPAFDGRMNLLLMIQVLAISKIADNSTRHITIRVIILLRMTNLKAGLQLSIDHINRSSKAKKDDRNE